MTDPETPVETSKLGEWSVPMIKASVCAVELDGEAVLLDDETGAVHALNRVATVVWLCLDGSVTVGGLIDDLVDTFTGADADTIRDDVLALVRTLESLGLLEPVSPDTPGGTVGAAT